MIIYRKIHSDGLRGIEFNSIFPCHTKVDRDHRVRLWIAQRRRIYNRVMCKSMLTLCTDSLALTAQICGRAVFSYTQLQSFLLFWIEWIYSISIPYTIQQTYRTNGQKQIKIGPKIELKILQQKLLQTDSNRLLKRKNYHLLYAILDGHKERQCSRLLFIVK